MHSSDVVLQTHSSRCFKLQIKFLCYWTCSIKIFMNSTLIMDPVHLNKLFSISNWLFLIPCYCQNSIGDLWNTLCSNRNYYPPPRDRRAFIRQERMTYHLDNFTSLNTRPERIYKEVYQSKLILDPPEPQSDRMGNDLGAWCKYHRIRGHSTDNWWQLKKEI